MKISEIIQSTKKSLEKPLQQALNTFSDIFDNSSENTSSPSREIAKSILSLLGAILWANGKIKPEELREVRKFLTQKYSYEEAQKLLQYIESRKHADLQTSLNCLKTISQNEKNAIIRVLLEVCYADGDYSTEEKKIIDLTCKEFELDPNLLQEIENDVALKKIRQENIFKSSAGIFAAIIILTIFILTATFLKSVLFGLILAYFFHPLERWFETTVYQNRVVLKMLSIIASPFQPLLKLKKRMTGLLFSKKEESITTLLSSQSADDQKAISMLNLACHSTVISVIAAVTFIFIFLFGYSTTYVCSLSSSIKSWADKTVEETRHHEQIDLTAPPQTNTPSTSSSTPTSSTTTDTEQTQAVQTVTEPSYLSSLLDAVLYKLENLKPKLEKNPLFTWAKSKIASFVNDDSNRNELLGLLLNKTGGVFSYTAGFISNIGIVIFNIVLTVFFFSFFLQKIALFNYRKRNHSDSDYLVMSIFESSWLPNLSKESLNETKEIISTVVFKLKTWIRSYLSIIIIESTIYIFSFFLLGVPYPLFLGFIAGCTILLPFLGPIVSCCLTIVVCFAVVPGTSVLYALIIVGLYCLMNGIIEQLFLYPALAGEALGLNTLETIIVVLLGGLFAGIPGMIFAVPATSILKYLIPKIYDCWHR